MSSEIMTALITSLSALAGVIISQLIISKRNGKDEYIKFENHLRLYEQKTDSMIGEIKREIGRLEDKQDKHNQIIERTMKLESSNKLMQKDIDYLKDEVYK